MPAVSAGRVGGADNAPPTASGKLALGGQRYDPVCSAISGGLLLGT